MGRVFEEYKKYKVFERKIAGIAKNNVWVYTVERLVELDDRGNSTKKTVIRIAKWRARIDKNNNTKYWQFHRGYNIRSPKEWELVSQIVDYYFEDNESSFREESFVKLPIEEYEFLRKVKQENIQLKKFIKRIIEITTTLSAQEEIYRKRLELMRKNLENYQETLKDFEELISDPKTRETDVHNFLQEYKPFWMFGLEYIDIESKVKFPPGAKKDYFEFDLMLRRYDGFYDLVELKSPNENIFDKRTKMRSKPNKSLSEALGQVITYLHYCDKHGNAQILKPKAFIVIGKKSKDKTTFRRIFTSYLNNIDILTYSELVERGNQLLKHIKKTP